MSLISFILSNYHVIVCNCHAPYGAAAWVVLIAETDTSSFPPHYEYG